VHGAECAAMAAIFNLNHPAHTVHWHFFTMSVANVLVIVVMLIVFALAILLPFPGSRGRSDEETS
jgi:hypothetical protein